MGLRVGLRVKLAPAMLLRALLAAIAIRSSAAQCVGSSAGLRRGDCATWQSLFDGAQGRRWHLTCMLARLLPNVRRDLLAVLCTVRAGGVGGAADVPSLDAELSRHVHAWLMGCMMHAVWLCLFSFEYVDVS